MAESCCFAWSSRGRISIESGARAKEANLNSRPYIAGLMLAGLVLVGASGARAEQSSTWKGQPVMIGHVAITVIDPYANGIDWPGLARALIGLARGDELTAAGLEMAQKALDAVAQVETRVDLVGGKAVLTFCLHPYKRIESIDVTGSYPLFESDVLKVMTVGKGDIFRPQAVLDQAGAIAQRYKDEGYIDPQVKIDWQQDKSDGHYHVHVRIEKGPAYVLSRVKLTGNQHIPDVLLMGLMSTWRRPATWFGAGRFVDADLRADIRKLTAHYRAQGYADIRIDYAVTRDPARRQVECRITIDEGPKYTIVFSGNRFFSDETLRKDLEIFTSGNRNNTGLRRGVLNIRRRYLDAGFADVRVSRSEPPAGQGPAGQKTVAIQIEEGLRHIVERVIIQGSRHVSTGEIRAQMLTRPPKGLGNGVYAASVLQEDLAAVRALYQKNGFLNTRVKDTVTVAPQTAKVDVTLDIDEGIQTLVGRVTIQGQSPVAADGLLAATQLKPGTPYRPSALTDDEDAVAAQIAARGYPHVLVKSRVTMAADQSRADIVFDIDAGPYVELGRVFWFGNFRTRRSLLKRQLKMKEGQPFSLAAVLDAQRRLRDLDLFQSVQVRTIGLKEKASKVHLLVTMVEKASDYFELGGGYQTDKGFYGRTKVGDRNFLGTGKDLRLAGEQSQAGYRWEAGATDPRLLASDVSADLGLYIENQEAFNQDFGYDTWGGKLTFARPWGPHVTTALGLSYERRQQYLRERDASSLAVDPETLKPRAIVVTSPAIRWDNRDSFIRPRRGGLASLAVDISRGLESSLDNFVKYKLDLRGYHTSYQQLTIAGRAFVGYIQPYGVNGQIPEDQLFFLGGTNDVRGFAENMLRFNADQNPVGGRLALAGNLEGRYDLTDNWELALFVDAGSVQKAPDNQGDDSWRYSAGLGLRYLTPIGPIGLLYGRKLNPRRGESNGQFHISIGYTF
jgi:outer membrane protein insertion porin family